MMKSNAIDFSKMLIDMESSFPQWTSELVVRVGRPRATVQSCPVYFKSRRSDLCLVGLLWTGLQNNHMIFLGETLLQSKVLGKRPRIALMSLRSTQIHST